jgi:RND superfamily putative drug exporter
MTDFRSLLLALKAAILNLFSIAAAYVVLVAAFQWGWGRSLLGMNENVPIEAYVPMVLWAIVFGLSMDYEIFLLSRVKETGELTHESHMAVAEGLSRGDRVIAEAAMIMVAVFLSFITTDLVAIKQLALGLGASVDIDATLIRLLLVPATMYLFGEKNWWLPRPLGRLLPHVSID